MIYRKLLVAAGLVGLLSAPAAAGLLMNVTLDYDIERDRMLSQETFRSLKTELSGALSDEVRMVVAYDAERVGERARTNTYAIMMAPAHLIGEAMKHGYTPVARAGQTDRVVLLATTKSGITNFAQARGKRLVMPHRESLVAYMLNGEMNAAGTQTKNYFRQVENMTLYDAVMYAFELGQADIAAVKESTAKAWMKKNPGKAVVIHALRPVPAAGVAVSGTLPANLRNHLLAALSQVNAGTERNLLRLGFGDFVSADRETFEYVSTLGYYTPRTLPGGKITAADEVKKLMASGVPLFDVRAEAQYAEHHIPGAKNLPYRMNSPKEIDFDGSLDSWDVSRLPADKNAPVIFQCNGAECWYSYKASRTAIKLGYRKVYWFRGGIPEWKSQGGALLSGS
jgi:ABC-type phosphate/phosphonate transport system substrate-binding protein/rhodanese-related sulfurtransferase